MNGPEIRGGVSGRPPERIGPGSTGGGWGAGFRWLATGLLLVFPVAGFSAPAVEAITFAVDPGRLYVPLEEAAGNLRWKVRPDNGQEAVLLNKHTLHNGALRFLVDGTRLVSLGDLAAAGASLRADGDGGPVIVRARWRSFKVSVGPKRAVVDLARQRLRAWQGGRLVLDSRISSGRGRSTPTGSFTAGPYKARRHFSSRYNDAPMPWSVQINGHIFIHGFTSVPDHPASHGCIRVPLDEGNPARFFYEWIDKGTPVRVMAGK